MTQPFCPHCGYDLVKDQPVILNDFAMLGPSSPLLYRGAEIQLTGYEKCLCWTLLKAYPHPVRLGVILDRMGSEALSDNIVHVYASRVRKKLREVGGPDPFKPTHHHGARSYVWRL